MLALVILVSCGLVILSVAMHLFLLRGLSHIILKLRNMPVLGMGISMLAAIAGHLVEILLFAVAFRWMCVDGRFGSLMGDIQHTMKDYFYFSALSYTSLGFGDIAPEGSLRTLAAIEAITGLVLIAWTASFAFLAMQELWHSQPPQS